jgi:hypothetical protein
VCSAGEDTRRRATVVGRVVGVGLLWQCSHDLTFIKLLILKSGKDLTSGFAVGVG